MSLSHLDILKTAMTIVLICSTELLYRPQYMKNAEILKTEILNLLKTVLMKFTFYYIHLIYDITKIILFIIEVRYFMFPAISIATHFHWAGQ